MTALHLIKTYQGFIPADQDSADAMEKMKWGKEYKAEITQPRNLGFHRKFYAMIGVAFDAWEMPVNQYKGIQIEKNRDRFRKDLMIMAGFGYPVVNLKGDVRYEAQSMSFANMKQDDFECLYSRVVDVVLQRVLTNYSRDDLDNVVAEVLGFV